MSNETNYEELKQKIKALEEKLISQKEAEKEELLSRRVEESTVKRIQTSFSIFGVALAAFAAVGLFAFGKYIEKSLSDSISRDVNAIAQREVQQISQTFSQKVDLELIKIKELLKKIEDEVQSTQQKAERAKLETEVRLGSTLERVGYMGNLLIKDVERNRQEIIRELGQESKKFGDARAETEKHSNEIVKKIKSELANLEKLTTVVRAPLSKKIETLKTLPLEITAVDADVQRYIAILVLKEMEDAELIRRENAKEEASKVILSLFQKDSLRDGFFTEVRFRMVRVVGELGLTNIACSQILNPDCLERGSLILLLGALGEPDAIQNLSKIIRNKTETIEIREKAIRSVVAIVSDHTIKDISKLLTRWSHETVRVAFSGALVAAGGEFFVRSERYTDPEIQAMRPRSTRILRYSRLLAEEQYNLVSETVRSVILDRGESAPLRKAALIGILKIRDSKAAEIVREILFNEWEEYGELAIDYFGEIRDERSVSVLHKFVLIDEVVRSLRLRCVGTLASIRLPIAITVLKDISQKDADAEVRSAARVASEKLQKDMEEIK